MKMRNILVLLLLIHAGGWAQDDLSKVGTGVAQFLKLGAGGRGTALGDAYSAMTEDVYAMYWNPAGIRKLNRMAVGVSQTELFADIRYNYFGFVKPFGGVQSIGLSVIYIGSGDIERTTIAEPEGTGEFFDTSHMSWGITYARSLTERFDLGITVKYVTERLYREKASTLAFDIGSQFNTGIYGMRIGMVLSNFGGKMKFDGPDLNTDIDNDITGISHSSGGRLKTEEWPIPLIFKLGVMIDIIGEDSHFVKDQKNRLTVNLEGNDPVDHLLRYNYGLEYEWNRAVALRLGYKENYDEADLTAGMGLNLAIIGINARIDYAYNDYGLLGDVHNYSIELWF